MKYRNSKYCIILLLSLFLLGCRTQKVAIKQQQFNRENAKIKYIDCNEALANNDFKEASKFEISNSSKQLIKGVELLQNQKPLEAEEFLKQAWSTDTTYKKFAIDVMCKYYFSRTMWKSFIKIANLTKTKPLEIKAVKEYAEFPKEKIEFSLNDSVLIPIKKLDYANTPIIEVQLNGKTKRFIVDTGFTLSAVSAEIAEECGIIKGKNSLPIIDANSSIKQKGTFTGYIQNLNIGGLQISNHPVFVSDNLKLKLLGITLHKIDGVIGWNLLQKLRVEIDYKNKNVLLCKSQKIVINKGLIMGIGSPFIVAKSMNGRKLFLHFDTGASAFTLFDNAKKKTKNKLNAEKRRLSFGINSTTKEKEGIIKDFSLFLGNNIFSFDEVGINKIEITNGLVKLDGRMGNKPFVNGRICFDYQNGIFEYFEE